MKPENERVYNEIPPYDLEQNLLVTRDKLPRKPGYRIAFTPIAKGLLRRNPYGHHSDEKQFLSYPDWVKRSPQRRNIHTLTLNEITEFDGAATSAVSYETREVWGSNEVTQIYATDEGLRMVQALGYHFFKSGQIIKPELWGGREIGKGSESVVYRATLADKDCVVKLTNHEGIRKMNEQDIFRRHFYPPNYLEKFGITSQISEILSGIEEIQPLESFELEASPIEYIAGENFYIEEYKRSATVSSIQKYIQKMDKKKETNETVEYWREWFEGFQREISMLEELFYVAGAERGSPFYKIDFNPPDWIITGFDRESGKLKLALIDQVPAPVASGRIGDYPHDKLEAEERLKELSEKYKNSPLLEHLMNCPIKV